MSIRGPRLSLALILFCALVACNGGGTSPVNFPQSPNPGATTTQPPQGNPVISSPRPTSTPRATATPTAAATSGSTTASVPFPAATDSDAFYAQTVPVPNLPSGTILNSRSVNFAPIGGAPMTNPAWEVQFVSHDVNGNPIAAIATVVKPLVAASGAPTLVSEQFAEDGLGAGCAPSHSLTGSTADYIIQAESALAVQFLTAGNTVVFPDHEGPNSEFAAGKLAGQITLDGIRAAENFGPLGLTTKTPVVLNGYSGGAIASSWAATLQAAYAPTLNIVGVASGGTPADVIGIVKNTDTNPVTNSAFFSLIFSAVLGANRAYPNLVTPILNAKGVAAAQALANGCAGAASGGASAPSGQFANFTTVADPYSAPNVLATVPLLKLPQANAPVADMFVFHSQVDELIPIAGADAMVAAWCAAGTHVAYYRGVAGDHVAFEGTQAPFTLAYATARLQGTSPAYPPGTTTCN